MNRDETLGERERRDLAWARCVSTHDLAPGYVAGCCVCQQWADSLTALTPADLAARDRVVAATAAETARARLDDEIAARKIAGEAADRFRDVLSECLGHPDENPGDDVLVAEVRDHFGKSGPEPRRWRDFITGALAKLDQIHAMPDPAAAHPDEEYQP